MIIILISMIIRLMRMILLFPSINSEQAKAFLYLRENDIIKIATNPDTILY